MKGKWIRAAGPIGYSGYFRRRVDLPGPIKHAWIAIVARDSFDIAVNGDHVGFHYIWRQSNQFQKFASEAGQVLNKLIPALELSYPREFQWSGDRNDLLPTFIDLTPRLVPGPNAITVELESSRAPAMVRIEGEVELWSGERVRLDTDRGWRAEPVPPPRSPLAWNDVHYPDRDWHDAIELPADLDDTFYRTFDTRLITTPFEAHWLRHPEASSGDALWFEAEWNLDDRPDEAWVRLAVNRYVDVFVNGHHVSVGRVAPNLENGDWVFDVLRKNSPDSGPEKFDAAEIGETFTGGERPGEELGVQSTERTFLPQRGGTDTSADFRVDKSMRRNGGQLPAAVKSRKSTETDLEAIDSTGALAEQLLGPQDPFGMFLLEPGEQPLPSIRATGEGSFDPAKLRLSPTGLPFVPTGSTPEALAFDRAAGAVKAYSISWLLRAGRNTIAIRLAAPRVAGSLNWPAQLAIDAESLSPAGARVRLASDPSTHWTTWRQAPNGQRLATIKAITTGPAMVPAPLRKVTPIFASRDLRGETAPEGDESSGWMVLPKIEYLGHACPTSDALIEQASWGAATAAVVALMVAGFLVTGRLLGWRENLDDAAQQLVAPIVAAAVVLATGIMTDVCLRERYESLYFQRPGAWPSVLLLAAMAMPLTEIVCRWRRLVPARAGSNPRQPLGDGLGRKARLLLLMTCLVGCAGLRAYKLDFQPAHDDEYTSLQGILAIARTGLPRFVPDGVSYSRSPMFHYLVGAVVRLFGENLWSFRLPTVWFAVGSCLLLYRFGSALMKRPWAGLAASALFAIHPITTFTGHMIRFYEQQSFFSLLGIYLFCRGFATGSSQKYRYLTLIVLLCAILSQEITAVMAIQIAVGALLFGRDLGWPANLRLILVGCCVVALVGLDFLVFQIHCLTRLEGVSPNMEASIQLHFWQPYYFVSIFLGYSRTHVLASLIILLAMPALIKKGDRAFWTMFWFLGSGVLLSNLLITNIGFRYIYRFMPMFLLVVAHATTVLASELARMAFPTDGGSVRSVRLKAILATVLLVGVVLTWSPWRVLDSYDTKILSDTTGALQFVRSHALPGDVTLTHEALPSALDLEGGKANRSLMIPIYHDFFLLEKGRLVDRNSGVEVVGSLDELAQVCAKNRRVWVIVNREKFRFKGQDIGWSFPGARSELFIRRNMQVMHRSLSWTVFLWDASRGHYSQFREDAK
jgi:4-amino-4-deoxy-L-arabinose transferase-like glycosyltransferase